MVVKTWFSEFAGLTVFMIFCRVLSRFLSSAQELSLKSVAMAEAVAEIPDGVPIADDIKAGMKKGEILSIYMKVAVKFGLISEAQSKTQQFNPSKPLPQLAKFKAAPAGKYHTADCPLCGMTFSYAQEHAAHMKANGCGVYRFLCGNYVIKRPATKQLVEARLGDWAAKLIQANQPKPKAAPRIAAGGVKRAREGEAPNSTATATVAHTLLFAQTGKEENAAEILNILPQLPPALSPISPPCGDLDLTLPQPSHAAASSGGAPTESQQTATAEDWIRQAPSTAVKQYKSSGRTRFSATLKPSTAPMAALSAPMDSSGNATAIFSASAFGPVSVVQQSSTTAVLGGLLLTAMHCDPRDEPAHSHWLHLSVLHFSATDHHSVSAPAQRSFALRDRADHIAFSPHMALADDGSRYYLVSICFRRGAAQVWCIRVAADSSTHCHIAGDVPSHHRTHTSSAWNPFKPLLLATTCDVGSVSAIDVAKLLNAASTCEIFRLLPEQDFSLALDGSGAFQAHCAWSAQDSAILLAALPLKLVAISIGSHLRVQDIPHAQRALGSVHQLWPSLCGVLLFQSRIGSQVNLIDIGPGTQNGLEFEQFTLIPLGEHVCGRASACCNGFVKGGDGVEELVLLATTDGSLELQDIQRAQSNASKSWSHLLACDDAKQAALRKSNLIGPTATISSASLPDNASSSPTVVIVSHHSCYIRMFTVHMSG